MNRDERLQPAFELLESAMGECKADRDNPLRQAALAKTFESTFEYAWKYFKREADSAGMETYSPRDALKAAAQLGVIENLELWNKYFSDYDLGVT